MKRENANKVSVIINKLNEYESKLNSLNSHSYNDEYEVYYRGMSCFDLGEEEIELLRKHYVDEIDRLNKELSKL